MVTALVPFWLSGACDGTGASGSGTVPAPLQVTDLAVEAAGAGLAMVVSFKTNQPAAGAVVVAADGEPAVRVDGEDPTATSHRIWVLGLRADTAYRVDAEAANAEATATSPAPVEWRSEPLPSDLPRFNVLSARPERMQGRYTLVAVQRMVLAATGATLSSGQRAVIFDSDGRVVWYFGFPPNQIVNGFALLANGNLAVVGGFGYAEIDPRGEIVRTDQLADIGVDTLHHDAVLLPSGNLVSLTTRLAGQVILHGHPIHPVEDVVVEFEPTGRVVRQWPLSDLVHFDLAKVANPQVGDYDSVYPDSAPTVDALHANSLAYSPETDTVAISLTNLGQILVIDRQTGARQMLLGHGGDTALADGSSWFVKAHGISWLTNGNILLYDNGGGVRPSAQTEYTFETDESGQPVARVVWTNQSDFLSPYLGNAQRLDNGNTLVCHGIRLVGGTSDYLETEPMIQEFAGNETVFEATIDAPPDDDGSQDDVPQYTSYRAYRVAAIDHWR